MTNLHNKVLRGKSLKIQISVTIAKFKKKTSHPKIQENLCNIIQRF